MNKKIIVTVLGLLTLSACSLYRIDSEEVSTSFYASKTSDTDVTYVETVTEPHEVIGFVTVNAERNQKMPEVLRRIRHEAAVIGGDAFTNITTNASGTWKKLSAKNLFKNANIRSNFSATVIVYKTAPEENK